MFVLGLSSYQRDRPQFPDRLPSALSPRRRFPREPQPDCCLRLEGQDRASEPRPGAHGTKQRHQDKIFFPRPVRLACPRPVRLASPRLLASYVCGKRLGKRSLKTYNPPKPKSNKQMVLKQKMVSSEKKQNAVGISARQCHHLTVS